MPLYLEARHLAMIQDLLRTYVPEHRVFAYGSRANGRYLKRFSDLDLALEGKPTAAQLSLLRDAFDESLLPIKVDLCELETASAAFRSRIEKDFLPVQLPGRSFTPVLATIHEANAASA